MCVCVNRGFSMVKHFRELRVYREAFDAAMRIFECSKVWPKEERYSLTHTPTYSHTHKREGEEQCLYMNSTVPNVT